MKTYAEQQNEKPFDWNAFLNKEDYTREELQEASFLSSQWVTCACGNQCHIIPRDIKGEPEDEILLWAGIEFHDEIENMRSYRDVKHKFYVGKERAKKLLIEIEQRSDVLIKQLKR